MKQILILLCLLTSSAIFGQSYLNATFSHTSIKTTDGKYIKSTIKAPSDILFYWENEKYISVKTSDVRIFYSFQKEVIEEITYTDGRLPKKVKKRYYIHPKTGNLLILSDAWLLSLQVDGQPDKFYHFKVKM